MKTIRYFLSCLALFFLELERFRTKFVQKIKTHFVLNNVSENHAFYEKTWKNIIEQARLRMTIWRLKIACWVTKATNTHSQYVILIAFPLQQMLHERTSLLHNTFFACLVT
jgi:hypothetical protein